MKFWNSLFYFSFLFKIFCQEDLLLDTFKSSSITKAKDCYFYKYNTIDTDFTGQDLVFRVKEPDQADIGQEKFSDPDVYISSVIILN
jgi:hypothetical protein